MTAAEVYQRLVGGADPLAPDARVAGETPALALCRRAVDFDTHVFASVLALAWIEVARGEAASLAQATGLGPSDLADLVAARFPGLANELAPLFAPAACDPAADEACLIELLRQCAADRTVLGVWLARLLARRAQRPNHLWQDLGLWDRGELNQLMRRHFPWLARRNQQDMKWKKFLYRSICRDLAHGVCAAPSCAECDDFAGCFGEEGGESLLAQRRAGAEGRL